MVAMIATAGITILLPAFFANGQISLQGQNLQLRPVIYFIASLYLLRRQRLNPILVLVLCGLAEILCRRLL